MFAKVSDFTFQQLTDMGFCGFVIGCLFVAVYALWKALQKERKRCEVLADKLHELSRETNIMIERITAR